MVKVGPWKAASDPTTCTKTGAEDFVSVGCARRTEGDGSGMVVPFVRSPLTTRFYLLKGRRGRINARARQSIRNTVVGGEETVIVHATEHSSKATFVMIASACL